MKELTVQEQAFVFKLKKQVNKTMKTYGLIEDNDQIGRAHV